MDYKYRGKRVLSLVGLWARLAIKSVDMSIWRGISLGVLISGVMVCFSSCDDQETQLTSITIRQKGAIPIPTQVQSKMANEAEFEEIKEKYLELIHGNREGIAHFDWRGLNRKNFTERSEWVAQQKLMKASEIFANGELSGEWEERGSIDQAGNVRIADYHTSADNIYAISDGGILWKSDINGSSWQPLNDQFVLNADVLKVIDLPGGGHRILSSIGSGVFYSDDDGATWTQASGLGSTTENGRAIDLLQLNDSTSTLVYLYTQVNFFGAGQNRIAYSTDDGANFTFALALNSTDEGYASMTMPENGSAAYILDESHLTYQFENGAVTLISNATGLTGAHTCQLEVSTTSTDTVFYVLMDDTELYSSTDGAHSFSYVNSLPTAAWDCGIGVSSDDPNFLYYGEVELYRSTNAGLNWNKVADWWEYYGDVASKIHADIMNIQTFRKADGTEFTLIPNHGGISISYDNLATTPNIGMSNLNVGQFYDVATSPLSPDFIFGGTQDQGFQRTNLGSSVGVTAFEQVISGDYGHQQFSNNGQAIWTEYPGADFSYYANAQTDGSPTFWYDISGGTLPNYGWIVPTAPSPNPAQDWILAGGGSTTGGSGSHLIRLVNAGGSAIANEFSFDFMAASGEPISAIETTPLDHDKWYVSTQNGRFYHSEDAGINWTETSSFIGPGNDWIFSADIYASRLTPGLVFLGGTFYGGASVYLSTDGGVTFTGIANGMPNTAVHELCMDDSEQFLFAATDAGPYVYSRSQDEWFYLGGTTAPIQEYLTCEFISAEQTVRFATWGRGIWDFNIDPATSSEGIDHHLDFAIFPNPVTDGVVSLQTDENTTIHVLDINGNLVLSRKLPSGRNELPLEHLPSGTYLLQLVGKESGKVGSERLIVL